MMNTTRSANDAFTFSLTGRRTIASFVSVPVLADNRINEAIDQRLRQSEKDALSPSHQSFGGAWRDGARPSDLRECV